MRGCTVAAFGVSPCPIGPSLRSSPWAASAVSATPIATSQTTAGGPNRSTTSPPQKVAAMKLSEPHSRIRP